MVRPNGARYWRMDYRWSGKRRTLAFGVYPTISLADAREKRDQAKKHLVSGIDPSAQRKFARQASAVAATNTFRVIAEEWLDKLTREGRAKPTLNKTTWLLSLAYPALGEQPIASIAPPDVLAVLRSVEIRGRYETAKRLRSTCGQVFRYAIATDEPSVTISRPARRVNCTYGQASCGRDRSFGYRRIVARNRRIRRTTGHHRGASARPTGICPSHRTPQRRMDRVRPARAGMENPRCKDENEAATSHPTVATGADHPKKSPSTYWRWPVPLPLGTDKHSSNL